MVLTFTQQALLNGLGIGLALGIVAGITIAVMVVEVKRINKEHSK